MDVVFPLQPFENFLIVLYDIRQFQIHLFFVICAIRMKPDQSNR